MRTLAYRKAATVAGVEETKDTEEFLDKGKELLGPAVTAAAKSKAPEEA